MVARYYAAGSGEEITAREAADGWRAVRFVPRVLRGAVEVDTTTTLHGTTYARSFGIAPTSLQRCADPRGELAMAEAAGEAGVPHVVSSNAGHLFSEIAAVGSPWWIQTYLTSRREDALPMIEAACAAGPEAVVLTVDTPVPGTKQAAGDADFVGVDLSWHRANYAGGVAPGQRGRWAGDLMPEDIEWLHRRTGLPVVVKGVLHQADALAARDAGAAAVWVSNHGGRQLDRAISTAVALTRIRAALGPSLPLYVDGGLAGGADVLAAHALGADAVFLGRLPLWALAADGRNGVLTCMNAVAEELDEALLLAGVGRPADAAEALEDPL
ncbi:MAG: alpha-hydroxy-acid oxidizing protein [Microbacteriaceae bacterium]|nr:alpha-hydroxy-acid oxidizing protein [Microbacteriaceae bacterium]